MTSICHSVVSALSCGVIKSGYDLVPTNDDAMSETTTIEIDDAMSETSTLLDLDDNRSLRNKFLIAGCAFGLSSGLMTLFAQPLLIDYPILVGPIVGLGIAAILSLLEVLIMMPDGEYQRSAA